MNKAVGKGAANLSNDVMEAVALFKAIRPDDGGFLGLPPQPALADAEQGRCRGNDDDFLVGVIRRFQDRWKTVLGAEPTQIRGTLFPQSLTMNHLKRLASQAAATSEALIKAGQAAAAAKTSELIGDSKMPAPPETGGGGTLDQLMSFVVGRKTNWSLGGSAGVAAGIGEFSAQWGSLTIIRPDKTELSAGLAGMGVGVSLAPGSLSYSGDGYPGGGIGNLYRGKKCSSITGLSDEDFFGKALILSGGCTIGLMKDGGASVNILFLGLKEALWGAFQSSLRDGRWAPRAATLVEECMASAKAIGMMWGMQSGTPDLGVSISLGALVRKQDQGLFGYKIMGLGFGGAIVTE